MPKASQVAPQPLVDSTESCRFYMIKAKFIRAYSGLKLPIAWGTPVPVHVIGPRLSPRREG